MQQSAAERAKQLFNKGYNCAQAVFCAFCEQTGMDFDTALKLSQPFGGGMSRLREVCGAVSGMFMVAGLKYGNTSTEEADKLKHYDIIQELAAKFKQENDTIICRELLENAKKKPPLEQTGPHNPACEKFVMDAAALTEKLLAEKG
jgi:C_GCAxxG_C_C family probable redox protein